MGLDRIHGAIAAGMTRPVFVCAPDGSLLYANPAGEAFSGRSSDQLRGQPCQDLVCDLPPDLARLTEFESCVRRADGTAVRAHVMCWPLGEGADLEGICLMLEEPSGDEPLREALHESEDRYHGLVENMLNGLAQYRVILDCEGRPVDAVFCEVNAAFEAITGICRESVLGMRVTEVRPDVDPAWVQLIGQVALTGAPARFERHSERLGKWFSMLAYRPSEGHCAIVSEDITEHHLALQTLEGSEARHRELVESANSIIIKLSMDGHVLFLNGFACRFFGVNADAVVDQPAVGALFAADTITEEEFGRRVLAGCHDASAGTEFEWPVHDAAGHTRWVSWSLRAMHDDGGEPEAILLFGHDVTEQREAVRALIESEEKFRTLFNNTSDGIFICDATGKITEANEVLCQRLDCERETLLRTSPEAIYGDGFGAEVAARLSAAPSASTVVMETTERGTQASGPVEISLRRISYGGQEAVLAVVRDIGQRRRLEDAQRMAALGQLAAGVAHEYNNLLAAMMMKAEMVALERTQRGYEELVEQVIRSCHRGAEICQNMIDFASPREPQRQPLQIEEPIEAALAITIRQMATADIAVKRDYLTIGRQIMADPAQIEQVFLNLLINAYHAMPHGGTVHITTRQEADEIVVTVHDTGTGIANENLPRVFEPFFTTKGRLGQSDMPGTGLGLSVSHGIINAHGGSIAVCSEPGCGSQFTVRLPVWLGGARPGPGLEEAGRLDGAGHRVLVAEDEADICSLLAQVLHARGYEVVTAADTTQALAALADDHFSLIVADWLMPGGGGRQITARAHELPDDPPVIIITGKPGVELSPDLGPNVVRCLQKPFHLAELLVTIQAALTK